MKKQKNRKSDPIKICRKCNEILVLGKNWSEGRKKWEKYICKYCDSKESREWGKNNKERANIRNKQWRKNNSDKIKEYDKKRYIKNKQNPLWVEKINNRCKIWRKENKGKIQSKNAYRKLIKKRASPNALQKEHKDEINMIYELSADLTKITNIEHHVHHIIPLLEDIENICGLHVPWNLEILTKDEHIEKHNKLRKIYANKQQKTEQ
jgi:RNase P subunit RPR2